MPTNAEAALVVEYLQALQENRRMGVTVYSSACAFFSRARRS
jgi:hypothetical protein